METRLNIAGLFADEQELRNTIQTRKICYDTEPYYLNRKGGLIQIGWQLNLYGTFSGAASDASPDSHDFRDIREDVLKVAKALSQTCNTLHMCESTAVEASAITYSPERKMRPDVAVHIPIFDQDKFGHPVDEKITATYREAIKLLESVGVRKSKWPE